MEFCDLWGIVQPSGVLNLEQLLDVMKEKTTSKNLLYRGRCWAEKNVALRNYRSDVIKISEPKSIPTIGDVTSYDEEEGE